MHTKLIHGEAAFTELAAEWNSLAQQGMTDTPFQSLAYQQSWWQNLHPEGGALHTIAVHDEDESLAAIACLYLVDGVVHFNGCVEETDYLDLICRAENAKAAWTAVFQVLCGSDFPDWHTIDLCNIPAASPSRAILSQLAPDNGLSLEESVHEVCPIITLPDSFDAYLDNLDSKQRREIRRKLRRADAADVEIHVVGADEDLETAVDDFLELLASSTFEKRDWLNEGRRAVFHETARAAMEAGTLQIMFAEVIGEKAAALFNFDYKDRIWVYNSGLDPASFGNLSLGVVLTARAIEKAIEDGRSEFDFLRGDEEYKYRFGAEDTTIYRMHITRKGREESGD